MQLGYFLLIASVFSVAQASEEKTKTLSLFSPHRIESKSDSTVAIRFGCQVVIELDENGEETSPDETPKTFQECPSFQFFREREEKNGEKKYTPYGSRRFQADSVTEVLSAVRSGSAFKRWSQDASLWGGGVDTRTGKRLFPRSAAWIQAVTSAITTAVVSVMYTGVDAITLTTTYFFFEGSRVRDNRRRDSLEYLIQTESVTESSEPLRLKKKTFEKLEKFLAETTFEFESPFSQ